MKKGEERESFKYEEDFRAPKNLGNTWEIVGVKF